MLTTIKDIQSFVRFTEFCRRFIRDYSNLTATWTDYITEKTRWDKLQSEAARAIKKELTLGPVMQAAPFEGTNKCKFETDDSRTCLGFILEQPDNEGKLMAVVQYRYKKTVRPT